MICHQTHRIQPMRDFGLCFGEHCQQHIPSQTFGNQKLTAVAPERDVKGIPLLQSAWGTGHGRVWAGVVRVIEQSLDVFHCPVRIIGIGPEEHVDQAHYLAE